MGRKRFVWLACVTALALVIGAVALMQWQLGNARTAPADSPAETTVENTSSPRGSDQEGESVNTDEQQIIDLYRRFHRDKVTKDTEDLGRFLTEDFVLTHMSGYAQPRQEWFDQIRNEQMRYFSSTEEHYECRVDGDTATLVGQNRVDARIYGNRNTWPLQLTFQYVKINGEWKISSATATTY